MRRVFPWLLSFVAFFFYPPAFLPIYAGKWLALYASGVFSAVYLLRAPRILPAVGWKLGAACALTAALSVAQLLYFRPSGFVFVLADRLSFLFLALGFWKAFREGLRLEAFWLPAALSAFFLSVFSLAGIGGSDGGLLGSSRAAAEGIGLMLLLAWSVPMLRRDRPFVLQGFFGIVSALSLYTVASRGDSLAALAWALALLVLKGSAPKTWRPPLSGIVGAVLGLGLSAGLWLSGLQPEAARLPSGYRWKLWQSTLRAIADLPFGMGPGRFEFGALPFLRDQGALKEDLVVSSPANEFLRFLSEDGIALALLFLALWGMVVFKARKGPGEGTPAVYAGLTFFLLAGLVSPVLLSATPVALLALLLGLAASSAFEARAAKTGATSLLAVVSVALVALSAAAFESRTYEDDPARAELSCGITPENWHACLTAARSYQAKGEWQTARHLVEGVLAREPANFTALQQLVYIAGNQKRDLEACFLLWRYDDFYGGASSQHERLLKNCQPKWLDYFHRKRPTRIYERQGKTPTGF